MTEETAPDPGQDKEIPEIVPAHPYRRQKLIFLAFAGAISIILLVIGGYQLIEFTDSTGFCGRLCHDVMYPEYTVYQASPHSRVSCANCHVGSGASYLVKSKISGMPLVIATLLGTYHRPITTPVENLRPARETCEQCHRPERFSGDLVRIHASYATDQNSTLKTDTRVLRVGGGEFESAKGIHWHIAASVSYLPLDKERQNIAWVSVQGADGNDTLYVDPKQVSQVTPQAVSQDKRLMDCVDCHNRATHIFNSPNDLLDSAFAQGTLDRSLPFLKWEGLQALDPPSASISEGLSRAESVKDFYRLYFPDVWRQKQTSINRSVETIKSIVLLTTFPHMRVSWKTYVDNIAHQDSPGCFRCHGKLVAQNGANVGKPVDAACDLCHYFSLPQ